MELGDDVVVSELGSEPFFALVELDGYILTTPPYKNKVGHSTVSRNPGHGSDRKLYSRPDH